ncbi:hypothetical protein [Streptomyces sp. NPDC048669]|uniref:hypothetical protein n=1 Tax=Streptomyces sp. NPDC048669 TaxID=3155267 RepID=UPI003428D274
MSAKLAASASPHEACPGPEVTVEKTTSITLTEHDDHTWADRTQLPGVSDAVRELITR